MILILLFLNIININAFISQIHIAQGKTYENMTISWISNNNKSEVRYGINSFNLNLSSFGYWLSYDFEYPNIKNYSSDLIHHVTISNFKKNFIYSIPILFIFIK
jgi:hypothetical protein